MDRILVIRLSAMGDVAMTVPVLLQLLDQYPNVHIDMLTRAAFRPLFPTHERLHFIHPQLESTHKGLTGLIRLFLGLKVNSYQSVADLHDVLRSQVLRTLFRLSGARMASIDKGRSEKKALTRKNNKKLKQLKSTHQRYADVFNHLGYSIKLQGVKINKKSDDSPARIGIAPFAAHREKMWPIEKTEQFIERLLKEFLGDIYLFGGGAHEINILNQIAEKSDKIISTADHSLTDQIKFMATLRVLVSMDSANMHMASNIQVPVVSIWAATHPYAGFLGYGQLESNCVQRTDLDCRPCSIFGNKRCWRGDWACLDVEVKQVMERVRAYY
jgi:ADP-heptose:LPS heptosyltransferase